MQKDDEDEEHVERTQTNPGRRRPTQEAQGICRIIRYLRKVQGDAGGRRPTQDNIGICREARKTEDCVRKCTYPMIYAGRCTHPRIVAGRRRETRTNPEQLKDDMENAEKLGKQRNM